MPTEETIGETFGVSRITVRQALDGLAQSGYIYKIQGKGSFVAAKKAGMQLNHLIGFSDEMRSIGMEPSTSLISQSLEFPSEPVANALELDGTQKVYIISRLRCADAVPMAVETVYLPFARFAGIETYVVPDCCRSHLSRINPDCRNIVSILAASRPVQKAR